MMELLDYERKHIEQLRGTLAECTVLLKTDGSFPLKEAGELALFGSGARRTVKGGTGSGEVNSRYFVTAEQGLEEAGFHLTTKSWLDAYDRVREEAKKNFIKEIKGATGTLKSGSTSLGSIMMPPDIAQKLYDYMDYTVETNYGKNYFCSSLDICAKTGTAEIDEGIAHAWVTGFSKDEDCPLAFAVVVEHGNSGYGVAIPVATAVLDAAAAASTLHPYSRFRSAP